MATDTNSIDYNDVSYVIKSEHRVAMLLELTDGISTPSNLSDGAGIPRPQASRAVNQLKERGIVDLIVEEDTTRGRLYKISDSTSDEFIETVREVTGE